MQKKSIAIAAIITFVLLLGGCDALFQNSFKQLGVGQPSDEALQAQLLSEDPVVQQNAQVAIIETKLQDAGAQAIVDGLTGLVALAMEGGDVFEEPDDLINALIPESLQEDPIKLAEAVDGLVGLETDLASLADQITANDGEAAAGVDAASLAQTALLVSVLASLEPSNPAMTTGEAVAELVTDPDVTPESLFNEPDFSSIESDPATNTLLAAAGYGTLEEFFQSFADAGK